MIYYARKDDSDEAPVEIPKSEVAQWNAAGYGVFQTVNEFNGRRGNAYLKHINSWFVEIDGDKIDLDELIEISIVPSLVVETRNGYHVYFHAINAPIDISRYRVVQHRLKDKFNGDGNALDASRILRVPGFYNYKAGGSFLCKTIFESDAAYDEATMLMVHPKSLYEIKQEAALEQEVTRNKDFTPRSDNSFIEWVDNQNQMHLLQQLSGSELVDRDVYKFRRTSGNKYNTHTNGKPSAWFIDNNGRIGSTRGAGPTVFQFVAYYLQRKGIDVQSANKQSYRELIKFFRG